MRKSIACVALVWAFLGCSAEPGQNDDGAPATEPEAVGEIIDVRLDTGKRIIDSKAEIVGDNVLIEGDIRLGKVKDLALDKPLSVNWSDLDLRWPNAEVPFRFADEVSAADRATLQTAMNNISARTRIKFTEVDWSCSALSMIYFVNSTDSGVSSSSVGKQGICQDLEFWPGHSVSVATHEITHALGVPHEQARPDRDNFVQICWNNIIEGREDNFAKKDADDVDLLTPYDDLSIMHYRRTQFSKFVWTGTPPLFGFYRPTIRRLGEAGQCNNIASGPAFGSTDQTNEDINALLAMYARPLGSMEVGDRSGDALSVGFIDADGYRDIAIGAPLEEVGSTVHAGAVTVYKGTLKHPVPWRTLTASAPIAEAKFGSSIAMGDFDGDGDRDLAIGAPGAYINSAPAAGVVYVFFTNQNGFTETRVLQPQDSLTGPNVAGDDFGAALAAADLNGDGRAELLVGSPGRAGAGRVHVFKGIDIQNMAQPIATTVLAPSSPQVAGGRFGSSIAIADVTNDGVLDVTIGAPKSGPNSSGAVHVFQAPSGTITHLAKLTQSTTQLPEFGDDFGASLTESTLVGTARSLVIGAPGKRKAASNTRTGAVFVYNMFATTGMFGLVHSIFPGDSEPQRFGHAVITASVSGTTQSIVIGAPEFNSSNGRAVIMRQSGSSMVKTHDMSGGGLGTTFFGSALAAGAIDVFTPADPSNFTESSKAPRIWVGAPTLADVGAVHAYTTGTTTAYYRHTLTQESGSPWSEWEE